MEPRIIANKIRTPDGTILQSYHRHDYVTYTDKNGHSYMVDGGLDYLRRGSSVGAPPPEEISVYDDAPFDEVRHEIVWGTRGKDGKSPLKRIKLSEMTEEHIQACLDTQSLMYPQYRTAFKEELRYRQEHNIVIKDEEGQRE